MSANKLLIICGIILGLIAGVVVYVRINATQRAEDKGFADAISEPFTDVSKYDLVRDSLVKTLEASMAAVNKRIDDLSKKQTQTQTGTSVTGVTPTTPPDFLTASPSPTTSTTTGAQSVYIPIGYGGSSTKTTDFENITGQEVTIDSADYPGFKQVVFEPSFRIFQANGTGEVRVFNKTDGTAVLSSVLSTTSGDYVVKTSSGFSLASGSKTYVVQAKSSTGYSVDLQLTRLRVDF